MFTPLLRSLPIYAPDHDLRYLAFTNLWLLQNISAEIFDWMLTSVCKYLHWHFNDKLRGAGGEKHCRIKKAVCFFDKMSNTLNSKQTMAVGIWEYDCPPTNVHFRIETEISLNTPLLCSKVFNFRTSCCRFRQNTDKPSHFKLLHCTSGFWSTDRHNGRVFFSPGMVVTLWFLIEI